MTPKPKKHTWWQLPLGLAISLFCLYLAIAKLLQQPDALAQIQTAFAQANYWWLLPFWLALVTFYGIKAWRWRQLLLPVGNYQTFRELLPPLMAGFALNNILPAHLGEFIRVVIFARRSGAKTTAVLSTVVLERVFDVIAILSLLGIGLVWAPALPPLIQRAAVVMALGAAVAVIGGLIFVVWTQPFLRLFEAVLARLPIVPDGLRRKLCAMLEAAVEGLVSLKQPRLLVGILASSLAQWLINAAMVHMALVCFGIPVSPFVSAVVMGVTAIAVTLPASPGYFGVIQLAFMTVLEPLTNDSAGILAASIFYQMAQYVPVTITGLICLNLSGLSVRQAEAVAATAPETAATTETADPAACQQPAKS